jgi:hypothetical protein
MATTRTYIRTSDLNTTDFACGPDGLTVIDKRVIEGAGDPVNPPNSIDQEAANDTPTIYYDTDDQTRVWTWDVSTTTWILSTGAVAAGNTSIVTGVAAAAATAPIADEYVQHNDGTGTLVQHLRGLGAVTNTQDPFVFDSVNRTLQIPAIDDPVNFAPAIAGAPTDAEALAAVPAGSNPGTLIWTEGTVDNPDFVWQLQTNGTVLRIEETGAGNTSAVAGIAAAAVTSELVTEYVQHNAGNGTLSEFLRGLANVTNLQTPFAFDSALRTLNVPVINVPVNFAPSGNLARLDALAQIAVGTSNPGTIIWSGGTVENPDYAWIVQADGSVVRVETPTCCPDPPINFTPAGAVPTDAEGLAALAGAEIGTISWTGGTAENPDYVWRLESDGTATRIEGPGGAEGLAHIGGTLDAGVEQADIQIVAPTVEGQPWELGLPWIDVTDDRNTAALWGNPTASGPRSIAIGTVSVASADNTTVVGGSGNSAIADRAAVFSGQDNVASGGRATIVGGFANTASGARSFVASGANNIADSTDSTVLGGSTNTATGSFGTVLGGTTNTATSSVVYGSNNTAIAGSNLGSIIGGSTNSGTGQFYGIFGGNAHTLASDSAGILAGTGHNVTTSPTSGIVAGGANTMTGSTSGFIGAGDNNSVLANRGSVVGGTTNTASGGDSTVIGSSNSTASGAVSGVFNGIGSTASGAESQAFGPNATASHIGAKVFAAGIVGPVASQFDNEIVLATDYSDPAVTGGHLDGGITAMVGLQPLRIDGTTHNEALGAADPPIYATGVQFFVRHVGGIAKLYVMDGAGVVTQLTP